MSEDLAVKQSELESLAAKLAAAESDVIDVTREKEDHATEIRKLNTQLGDQTARIAVLQADVEDASENCRLEAAVRATAEASCKSLGGQVARLTEQLEGGGQGKYATYQVRCE